jgi:hypothetical protein
LRVVALFAEEGRRGIKEHGGIEIITCMREKYEHAREENVHAYALALLSKLEQE